MIPPIFSHKSLQIETPREGPRDRDIEGTEEKEEEEEERCMRIPVLCCAVDSPSKEIGLTRKNNGFDDSDSKQETSSSFFNPYISNEKAENNLLKEFLFELF